MIIFIKRIIRKEEAMFQWQDETLVAIFFNEKGRYGVMELPARQTEIITSRRSFRDIESAEAFVADQYPNALVVRKSDILDEGEARKAQLHHREEVEPSERDGELLVTRLAPGAMGDARPAVTAAGTIQAEKPEEEQP
jgi:hypothetical protein